MYITQVKTIQNDWWRYILGVVISFIGVAIFLHHMPLLLYLSNLVAISTLVEQMI